MPKKEDRDARRAVIREWDLWSKDKGEAAKTMGGFTFFNYLQTERSGLLNFQSGTQDKWQIVHGWLLREGRVND